MNHSDDITCAFCHKPCPGEGYFHAACARPSAITNSDGGYINSSDEGAAEEKARWTAETERIRQSADVQLPG